MASVRAKSTWKVSLNSLHPKVKWFIWRLEWIKDTIGRHKVSTWFNQACLKEKMLPSYVRIQDVVPKTYLGRWTIGRSGERGSGISVLPARYDDDIYMQNLALNKSQVLICHKTSTNQAISQPYIHSYSRS